MSAEAERTDLVGVARSILGIAPAKEPELPPEATALLDKRDAIRAELATVDDEELRRIERACFWQAAQKRQEAWALEERARDLLKEARDLDYRRKQVEREQAKRNGFDVEGDAP